MGLSRKSGGHAASSRTISPDPAASLPATAAVALPRTGTRAGRGNVSKTCPRYGSLSDHVLKVAGVGEGARDERLHAYLAGVAVERDREAENVEDATAKFGVGYSERFGEVGERVKDLAGVVEVDRGVCAVSVVKRGERGLQFVAFGLQCGRATTSPTRRATLPAARRRSARRTPRRADGSPGRRAVARRRRDGRGRS